jgi:ribosomal protein S18 acetylase RimI-like enzyme
LSAKINGIVSQFILFLSNHDYIMQTQRTMTIRLAHLLDIPLLIRYWQSIDNMTALRPFGGDSQDKIAHAETVLKHAIGSAHAVVLVATTEEGEIIGTISGHVFEKPGVNISNVGVIYSLWIESDYRCQGIGQQLLSKVENALMVKGAQAFQVGWDTGNSIAKNWWQKRGYASYETIASKLAAVDSS